MIRSIPVVMFHGVAPDSADRPPQMDHWLDPSLFEKYLAALRRDGFHFVFLDEVMRFKRGEIDLPRRSISLTFDDGYLDFWLYVYPLLTRYDAKATVFVNTDFVDGDGPPRRLGADFPWGFLSWSEMREMRASGRVEIQSHAKTHTWYFTGPKLLDAHRPGLPWRTLRFLWWNRFPERKPAWYREGRHEDLPWGVPVLENEKSLLARKYELSPEVGAALVARVAEKGGRSFFDRADWLETYRGWYEEITRAAGDSAGRYETEDERRARLCQELGESREELSRQLGEEIRFLLCPGGSLSFEVLDLAHACGYYGVSIPSTRWPLQQPNRRGGDSTLFYRISSGIDLKHFQSDRVRAELFRWRVSAELGIPRFQAGWFLVRALRRARLL